jgi:phosphoesterase RecJ-like protein
MVIEDKVIKTILKENNFIITTHISPDGDGLGSALALKRGFESIGKKAFIVIHSKVPQNLKFLLKEEHEIEEIKTFSPKNNPEKFFTVVVDMGCFERLGDLHNFAGRTKGILIIDHHIVQIPENVLYLIDTSASATGEVVYDFLMKIGVKLTKEIAEPLYVAIETDTGGFRFKGTTPATHRLAAIFLEKGVDPGYIHTQLYENESPIRLKVMGEVFSTISLSEKGKIASMELRQRALQKLNAKIEDGDDLVQYLMIIEGVKAGFYFKEISSEKTKISSRSKGDFNLDAFLSRWGGGGHPNAAGLLLNCDIESAKKIVLSEAIKLIENQ